MKKWVIIAGIVLSLFLIPGVVISKGKPVRMVSLDWPPYTGGTLEKQGANVVVAKAAFEAMGYDLEVKFYPWARTILLAKTDKYSGYFPEYYAKSIEKDFIFSDPIGDSPLGFVELASEPVTWNTLDDLKTVGRIGIVRGYVNTEGFDKMVADRLISAEPVVDDRTNLRKLLVKRIKMAVIDKFVMQYILNTDSSFLINKNKYQFNAKLLEVKELYLCFQNNDSGREIVEVFNQGLKKIDQQQLTKDYFKTVF